MTLSLSSRVESMQPSATLRMAQAARELQDEGVDVVTMSAGEPDFNTAQVINDIAKASIDQGKTHYVPVRGTKTMIKAMQEKFLRDQGIAYEPQQVICTVGAKASIFLALEAIVNPGDEVIIFAPFWVSYKEQIRLLGGVPVVVDCKAENNFMPSGEDLRAVLTKKTKAMILNSPNNPTGGVISQTQLKSLADALAGSSVWVIADEIYEKLLFEGHKHVSIASINADMAERTIVISGASKGYAMTGWRVGVVGGNKTIINAMEKLQGQQTTCLPEFIQDASAFALRENELVQKEMAMMLKAYDERRKLGVSLFEQLPKVKVFRPQGAFYLWIDFSSYVNQPIAAKIVHDDIDLATRMLKEARVASVPGGPFGGPGFLRFSIASSTKDIETAFARIHAWLTS